MSEMLKRAAATQACMDRFAGKPVIAGKRDCATLAAHAMHKMGRKAALLTASNHTTWAGAVKYLRQTGFASLPDLMDAMGLDRIAPAMAWPGDIVALPAEADDPFGCSLTVMLDNGRVLAANPTTGLFEPMTPHLFVCAWRV